MAGVRRGDGRGQHRTVGSIASDVADIPAEAMLDPVANTLDLRDPFDEARAKRVLAAVDATGVEIADVAYFDDMLHEDPAIRQKKHDFMIMAMDAAVLLGVEAVCGFVGRDQSKSMEENLIEFEQSFVPLLQAAKDRGLQYRVEQCPMPGWTAGDNFHNNIAYAPGTWIALHQIAEKHGVGDQFRIHYDPSHAILMGQDTRSLFQYLKDEGYPFLIAGMHVKGQVVDSKGVSGWGYGGQTVERGDWVDGAVSANPADLANAWKKQIVLAEHELPGTARHDPLAYLQNRSVDWLDHQLAARELLDIDFSTTPLIVEHEYPPARVQEKDSLQPILAGSIAFTPTHRSGRRRHVRPAERSSRSPGHTGSGSRSPGLQELTTMTEFFADVPSPVAFAGTDPGDGFGYRVYDPDRMVAGKRMEDQLRIAVCYWHSFAWPGSDVFGDGTFDRPWVGPVDDPARRGVRQAGRRFRVLRQARHALLLLP